MRDLVLVRWSDAWFDAEAANEWRESYLVETIGILVRDELGVVSIAHEVTADGDYRAVTHIPKSLVEEIVHLIEDETAYRAEP